MIVYTIIVLCLVLIIISIANGFWGWAVVLAVVTYFFARPLFPEHDARCEEDSEIHNILNGYAMSHADETYHRNYSAADEVRDEEKSFRNTIEVSGGRYRYKK